MKLRPWKLSDAKFICQMRNKPELMRWFRQDQPITLKEQKAFMRKHPEYNGQIVEEYGQPLGVLAIKDTGELSVVMDEANYMYLPELLADKKAWGEVFIKAPILRYLLASGFKVQCLGNIYKDSYTLLVVK